jgi:hypothetical protein
MNDEAPSGPQKNPMVEHGVVIGVELRIEARTLALARQYGRDWLRWNLMNLILNGKAIEPYSNGAPREVAEIFVKKDMGTYFQSARLSTDYIDQIPVWVDCAGQLPGDSRGKYGDRDWIEDLADRFEFYRSQEA